MVVQAIYAVRPVTSRHPESAHIESLLDRWFDALKKKFVNRHEKVVTSRNHLLKLYRMVNLPFLRLQSITN